MIFRSCNPDCWSFSDEKHLGLIATRVRTIAQRLLICVAHGDQNDNEVSEEDNLEVCDVDEHEDHFEYEGTVSPSVENFEV
ncbi:hypothetical protein CDL15_Pgr025980 [Punica granatum]|uniref:Uncharacterized protein n=1 Tax=Punica granatum TaxID=22663 RepID=A0A218WCR7_PUNGR|nr:hypothetical protein CDL15_Pgr025980 [Punica granatum]